MTEAYFESNRSPMGSIHYPYECMIQSSVGSRWVVHPHWHIYIEILYFLSGQAKVFLGGESHILSKGDLILIHSHETHSIYSLGVEKVSYVVIKFDPEILYSTSRTIFESKYVLPFTMAKSTNQRVFTEQEIIDTPIPALVTEIYDEFTARNYGFELAVRTLICKVFLWFLRKSQDQQPNWDIAHSLKEIDFQMLQQVFEYIDERYMDDITAETAARMCNLSYSYFSRKFKAIMGKTFTNYLNYIRITEAEKLLLTTDSSMTEIALEVGFSNSSYFIQQFKQYKNISPSQFRKKITEESSESSELNVD
ncbi:helix-turn-helix domain-containing protein [Paenibacillus pini]|uniref:Transcriptional regulator n=1 Tax=Paenibacillus pini JCM 16418 TaxID=1236976 RepID=W7YZ93_9BACL|nr:helix-turn-helix domain-containing protein [Paenibacillus pini]GAF07689.1 transcriptional regulator [Paenibacillus pini JCM 16418]